MENIQAPTPVSTPTSVPSVWLQAADLFAKTMDLNREAFEGEDFDAAYHALAAALHLATAAHDEDELLLVKRVAREQLDWIAVHAPAPDTPSTSPGHPGIKSASIWEGLASIAQSRVDILHSRDTLQQPLSG